MSLHERILEDLKTAMRSGDVSRREAIRMLRAAILNEEVEIQRREFEVREAGARPGQVDASAIERHTLTDEEIFQVIQRLAKRHRDSIEQFKKAGRTDLAAHEEAQLRIIEGYLPRQLGRDEVEAMARAAIAEVGATGRKDMGRVMSQLGPRVRGRANMGEVSGIVQDLLGS